ncbi:MAG: DNA polymerase/3'-5' exonuclease PolX [Elusimicrobiota bacterium]
MKTNERLAEELEAISKMLKFKKENPFKIRAFEDASRVIRGLDRDISDIVKSGNAEKIASVGKGMAGRINEFLDKGYITQRKELEKEVSPGLLEIMEIPGVGPAKARILHDKLNVKSLPDLRITLRKGLIKKLEGFGEKSEKNIAEGLAWRDIYAGRMILYDADRICRKILRRLKSIDSLDWAAPAGSLRRRKATVKDIDILYTAKKSGEEIGKEFTSGMAPKDIIMLGDDRISVIWNEICRVDLRKIEKENFAPALQYFTGSKEHNVALRKRAKKFSLKLNEYGLFSSKNKIECPNEKDIYKALKMQYICPELREGEGEIKAALDFNLPKLICSEDIKGDFHVHSNFSDGASSIEQIADKARDMGYEWVGICDHSRSLKIAGGLSIRKLNKKIKKIRELNKNSKIKIFCGQEVDILSDGSLDYPDEVLEQLDFVIAAIHSGFKDSEQKMTGRILKAMENPFVNIFAHPSGRLLNEREAYNADMIKIIKKAAETSTALEINAYPRRLDLYYNYARMAAGEGVKMAIGTDSHHAREMDNMKYGLDVARRGWLEKKNTINTISIRKLQAHFKEKRRNK